MLTQILTSAPTAPFCGAGPAWWPLFPILWFLLVAMFVAMVIVTVARGGWWRHRLEPGRSAQARLAERYAAGEIDESEYRERLAVLKEQP
jgi:putative membrane protein